jgi:asparagine N-glycosylation enzyme membrane subunit Stt3
VHRRQRLGVVVGIATLWVAWSLIAGHLERAGVLTFGWSTHLCVAGGVAVALGVASWLFRKALLGLLEPDPRDPELAPPKTARGPR